jgi:GTP cyclohydrolase I
MREHVPWFQMDGNGILGNTAAFETVFRDGLREFLLVRHVDSSSFSSHHLLPR